jgi:hypothetical protein
VCDVEVGVVRAAPISTSHTLLLSIPLVQSIILHTDGLFNVPAEIAYPDSASVPIDKSVGDDTKVRGEK